MIIFYISLLVLLTGFNWYISKTVLYPPVIFTAWWSFCLFILFIVGDMFYTISYASLSIYFIGGFSFSLGGIFILSLYQLIEKNKITCNKLPNHFYYDGLRNKIINIILILVIVALPFYVNLMIERAGSVTNYLLLARRADLTNQLTIGHASLVDNIVIIAIFIAFIALYESRGLSRYKVRTIVAILVAFIYSSLNGSKASDVGFLFGLMGIYCIYVGRLKVKYILIAIITILFLFSVVTISRNRYNTSSNVSETVIQKLPEVEKIFMDYWLGGIVAFDKIVNNPSEIPNNWHIYRYFIRMYSRFDPSIKAPLLHAEYTSVSPTKDTNVYTLYFAYFPEFGIVGVILIMTFLGAVLTLTYKQAIFGSPSAIIFYGVFLNAIVMSIFNESFFMGLNEYVKLYLFLYLFYHVLPVIGGGISRRSYSQVNHKQIQRI